MNRKSDEQYLSELRELFTTRRAASALSSRLMPASIVGNWLGDLRLLTGVPFTNLVANNRTLPRESIRFFYVDDNWLDAMQDGATSIGLHSSLDAEHQRMTKDALIREAEIGARQQRRRRRNQPLAKSVMTGTIRTGFLLRSAVVSGWPGLEVRAFADREGKQGIELLRLERLAPDVMICIISGEQGIPARIDISEPSEGLQFGIVLRSRSNEPRDTAIPPRWPGLTQPERTGEVITKDRRQQPVTPDRWVPPVMRKKAGKDTRVLDVIATRANLKSRLIELGAMTQGEELESADFALQMVKSPAQQPFSADHAMPLAKRLASAPDAIEIERLP